MKSRFLRLPLVVAILAAVLTSTPVQTAQAAATDCTVSGGTICKITYSFTGALETFTVPSYVTALTVELVGAQGGSGSSTGGLGGYIKGTLAVSGNSNVFIYVGGQNGWNGGGAAGTGGAAGYTSSNGGGATDIRIGGYALTDRKAVGGGGGGAGRANCTTQGGGGGGYPGGIGGVGSNTKIGGSGTATNGGSVVGSSAFTGFCDYSGTGGGGGGGNGGGAGGGRADAAGGSAGSCGATNTDSGGGLGGCFGLGGNGGNYATNGGGGGGGGGWYGGGAGGGNYASGGGGGSSYLGSMTSTSYTNATNSGNGYATISYSNVLPFSSFSVAGSATQVAKGEAVLLSTVIGLDGKVTFYADGKRIAGCVAMNAVAGTKTCSWKPTVQKSVKLYAALYQGSTLIATSPVVVVGVVKKSSIRT